jgi:hypothetical protein
MPQQQFWYHHSDMTCKFSTVKANFDVWLINSLNTDKWNKINKYKGAE